MEHGNGWCFRGIYKGGLWEDDLHVSALQYDKAFLNTVQYENLLNVFIQCKLNGTISWVYNKDPNKLSR